MTFITADRKEENTKSLKIIAWRTASDNIQRSYGYNYDPLNRLQNAHYKIPNSSVIGSYNEQLTYDSNGNILTLKRNGLEENEQQLFQIDDLDYEYEGNQLLTSVGVRTCSPLEDSFACYFFHLLNPL